MGQKVHPYGFRLGIICQPKARWFATGREYSQWLVEDLKIRRYIRQMHRNAGISEIIIDRSRDTVTITIKTAKPGVVIGRGGRDVDALRQYLERMTGKRTRVNVEEAPEPDINAQLVAESIARQIERRVSHRWAMRQAIERAMRQGAKGIRIKVAGRLNGADIARTEAMGPVGRVPLQTLRADIDYGIDTAHTTYGPIGVRVWIYHGDILPQRRVREEEEAEALEAEIAAAQAELHGEPEAAAAAPAPAAPEAAPAAEAAPEKAPAEEPAAAEQPAEAEAAGAAEAAEAATAPQPIVIETPEPETPALVEELMDVDEPVAAEIEQEEGEASEAGEEADENADA
ncbi:MAG: 30S ribosomal protein S3 [Armatimonadetes bacterium]|nr:30S ribosomal protein S3 [Armatimonadota bacterium]